MPFRRSPSISQLVYITRLHECGGSQSGLSFDRPADDRHVVRKLRDRLGYLEKLRARRLAKYLENEMIPSQEEMHPIASEEAMTNGHLVGSLKVPLTMGNANISLVLYVEDLTTDPSKECTTLTGSIPYGRCVASDLISLPPN